MPTLESEVMFIYSPSQIIEVLDGLPHLRDLIDDPAEAGIQASGFPKARKTPLQIYRILSNNHYDRLQRLLESLDFCTSRDYLPPKLVKRPDRARFDSDLAEARLAEHLLRKSFTIQDLEATKGSSPVPDFLAHRNDLELAVEVYAPRTRLGIDLLMDELKDPVKNLDEPIDFKFDIAVDQLSRADAEQNPLWLHPTILGRGLEQDVRAETLERIMRDLEVQLDSNPDSAGVQADIAELNIGIRVELTDIRAADGDLPDRFGWIHDPPLSGYAPEGIFTNLVKRRVSAKLRKGQAPKSGLAPLSLLGMDMAHCSDLTTELSHEGYRSEFKTTLEKHLPNLHGYDFVVVYEPNRDRGLTAHFLISADTVETDAQQELFKLFEMAA